MCFSFQSSIVAWLFANIVAVYLWKRNRKYDRWNATFIFTFTLIQLFEAGLWYNDPKVPSSINSVLTALILVALTLQPLVQSYAGYIDEGSRPLYWMSVVYGVIVLYTLYRLTRERFRSTVGEHGHLVWESNKHRDFLSGGVPVIVVLYLAGLFLPLLKMEYSTSIPLILVGVVTALYSASRSSSREFGSLWCFTAVAYSVVALVVS